MKSHLCFGAAEARRSLPQFSIGTCHLPTLFTRSGALEICACTWSTLSLSSHRQPPPLHHRHQHPPPHTSLYVWFEDSPHPRDTRSRKAVVSCCIPPSASDRLPSQPAARRGTTGHINGRGQRTLANTPTAIFFICQHRLFAHTAPGYLPLWGHDILSHSSLLLEPTPCFPRTEGTL